MCRSCSHGVSLCSVGFLGFPASPNISEVGLEGGGEGGGSP